MPRNNLWIRTRIRWNNSDTPLILSCVWVAVMADKSSISYRRTRATIYSILYTDIWWKIGLEKYSKILKRKFLIELERKKLGWKYIYLFKTLFSQTMKIIFNTLSWCLIQYDKENGTLIYCVRKWRISTWSEVGSYIVAIFFYILLYKITHIARTTYQIFCANSTYDDIKKIGNIM